MFPMRGSERTWTKASAQLIEQPAVKRALSQAIDGLSWDQPPAAVPSEVGEAVGAIMEAYGLPGMVAVAFSGAELRPCRLLGLETRYREGAARHYWLDVGSEYLPLATDLWRVQ